VLAVWVVVSCGDDGSASGPPSPPFSPSGASVDPFGLNERPASSTCKTAPRPDATGLVAVEDAFGGITFSVPVLVLQAPGDPSRWFVVEKRGTVKVVPAGATLSTTPTVFIDVSARVNDTTRELGLLGMAFHPSFATNHEVYLSYTAPSATSPVNAQTIVSRFVSRDGGLTLDPTSEEILLQFDTPTRNHKGGNLAFDRDGYLFLAFGDGGELNDPNGNAQNPNVLQGKVLRIDVDSGSPYAIPPDNPFATGGGRGEIYAFGFRNPWRWSFDRESGALWLGDVGESNWEEVDRVELAGNYGWNPKEGTHCYPPGSTACAGVGGLIDPIVEYDHGDGRQAIIGGFVYRGSALPWLVGTYIYGDFSTGTIWGLFYDPITGAPAPQVLADHTLTISSFGEGLDGELYLTEFDGPMRVHKIVPSMSAPAPTEFPQTLSATGCVDAADARKPAAGLIPYDVNVPLWSDGADTRRFMALPDGARIHVDADGQLELPIGAVLMEELSLGGNRVETRLLMRHDDGNWAGYSYEWNDAQTDATLLAGARERMVGAVPWYFPSRNECLECHNGVAGRTLGLEISQLNRDFAYPSGLGANQLTTLDHIGLLDAPIGAPAMLPALPQLGGSAPLSDRARAYLHANCAICHRPNGPPETTIDLRYATPFGQTGLCRGAPSQGDLGVSGALLVTPGAPPFSILSLRMHALGAARMPPLGSHKVDPLGTSTIDQWIESLTACP
jgi:uncharacterized repeat protein (TIGR03806 family)